MGKQIKMEEYAGYLYIEGGVCAAQGFTANGLNCGLNPDKAKNDLGMVYSERLCTAAAVYTTNKVKGAPVLVTKRHLEMSGGTAKAVIVNSKNANTCNADGVEIAEKISELAAQALEIRPEEVIIASTGVIAPAYVARAVCYAYAGVGSRLVKRRTYSRRRCHYDH